MSGRLQRCDAFMHIVLPGDLPQYMTRSPCSTKCQPGSFSTLPQFVVNGGEEFTGCFGSFGCPSDRDLGKINRSASHISCRTSTAQPVAYSSTIRRNTGMQHISCFFAKLELYDYPCSRRNFIQVLLEFRISDQMRR